MNLKEIINKARINGTKKFEQDKEWTNKDNGKQMISFCHKTLGTRKVNDWGREEDNDVYIGLDTKGWIKYNHTIEHLEGDCKIKEENTTHVTDEDILNYLTNESCTNEEYLMFMSKAFKYYRFYYI